MSDSPIVQPLHNPSLAAQFPAQAPGAGAKALLAKRVAKNTNPYFVSPTDNMMTPCTQKLNAVKKKHFTKSTKPIQLFPPQQEKDEEADEDSDFPAKESDTIQGDDENPF